MRNFGVSVWSIRETVGTVTARMSQGQLWFRLSEYTECRASVDRRAVSVSRDNPIEYCIEYNKGRVCVREPYMPRVLLIYVLRCD